MVPSHPAEAQEALASKAAEQLLAIADESSRRSFLEENPHARDQSVVFHLTSQVPKIARHDADRALQLVGLANWLSEILDDHYCRARSARAMGHVLQLKGRLRESLVEYDKALELFGRLKLESETGITLSGSLQPLILLGDYKEPGVREERARQIFKRQGDELRLARLDSNLGNILHRQDRFEEALVLYRRAEQALQRLDAADDVAILLNNLAVCYISVHDFTSALETYGRLRKYSQERHLQLLAVQADYNIAYMHYLQGDHHRAMHLYEETRAFCARAGDPYHAALCDLDQSEIYLHLNRDKECAKLAQSALAKFENLNMKYEAAKAYTFLGLAACQQSESSKAMELFAKARELFLLEQNWIWPPLIDLYRAIVLYRAGSWTEALKTVQEAQSVLSHSALKNQAALAEILRSILHLKLGDPAVARYWGELALERVRRTGITGIDYLAEFVLGCVREKQNDALGAQQHYKRAKRAFDCEAQRGRCKDFEPGLCNDAENLYRHLLSVALRLPSPERTGKPT